jgi:hypothetical protein
MVLIKLIFEHDAELYEAWNLAFAQGTLEAMQKALEAEKKYNPKSDGSLIWGLEIFIKNWSAFQG